MKITSVVLELKRDDNHCNSNTDPPAHCNVLPKIYIYYDEDLTLRERRTKGMLSDTFSARASTNDFRLFYINNSDDEDENAVKFGKYI